MKMSQEFEVTEIPKRGFFSLIWKVVFIAMLVVSPLLFAGCGGSGATIAPVTNNEITPAPNGDLTVTKVVHQGAVNSLLPVDVWGDSMSGRYWSLFSNEKDAKELSEYFMNGRYTHSEGVYGWEIEPVWSVTRGLGVSASETISIGNYKYELDAIERIGVEDSMGTKTQVVLNVNVVADDYVYPITSPAEGGQISCGGSAIVINEAVNWNYGALYRMNPDGSRTHMRFVVGQTETQTVVIPAISDENGNSINYVEPGNYTLEIGYGTSWETTGDYKTREIKLNFQMIGDEGTTGYMCQNIGQKVSGDIQFTEMPFEKTAKTEADKVRLNQKAMEDFFSKR